MGEDDIIQINDFSDGCTTNKTIDDLQRYYKMVDIEMAIKKKEDIVKDKLRKKIKSRKSQKKLFGK